MFGLVLEANCMSNWQPTEHLWGWSWWLSLFSGKKQNRRHQTINEEKVICYQLWVRKVTCQSLNWMLQLSSGQKWLVCVNSDIHEFSLLWLDHGAFRQNVSKLFSKLLTDNLLFIYAEANWETTEIKNLHCRKQEEVCSVTWLIELYLTGLLSSVLFFDSRWKYKDYMFWQSNVSSNQVSWVRILVAASHFTF